MFAYKAFDKNLKCRGYQFELGFNTTEKANCRQNGFHCAENPIDCLSYYSNMGQAEYYLVDAGGDIDEDDLDTKIACTELTILQQLPRKEFFLHALAFMVEHPFRKWSTHIKKDCTEAKNGYAIVRGIDPIARGKKGDILAFAKENGPTGKITQVSLTCVDGKDILPNVWYGVDLKERGEIV